jgi:hypothetical protein
MDEARACVFDLEISSIPWVDGVSPGPNRGTCRRSNETCCRRAPSPLDAFWSLYTLFEWKLTLEGIKIAS